MSPKLWRKTLCAVSFRFPPTYILTFCDLSYKMFEAHMDEYLDEEIEWVKHAFDVICKGWDQEVRLSAILCGKGVLTLIYRHRHHLLQL